MIRVRDDDVLMASRGISDPLKAFKNIHKLIRTTDKLIHVPAILMYHNISENFLGVIGHPGAIEFIRNETVAGNMLPEIHGYEHVDYGKIDYSTVVEHLNRCQDFIWSSFKYTPTIWYTPWGASQQHLHEAADTCGLKLVDCSRINKLNGRNGIIQRLKDGEDISFLNNTEVFMHWWQGPKYLNSLVETLKNGSWIGE